MKGLSAILCLEFGSSTRTEAPLQASTEVTGGRE